MTTKVTKEFFLEQKKIHKEPITLLYHLFIENCDASFRINQSDFEKFLHIWLAIKYRTSLVEGSLHIVNYFYNKFAQ